MLPTGQGKSLVYQAACLLLRDHGITLVITPLIALMADQLLKLPKAIRGASLHSQQTPEQQREIQQKLREGDRLDLLYITPERLAMWAMSGRDLRVSLAVVDEAHCVSTWSHNFRPTYMRLNHFFNELKIKRVMGLTATATRKTIAEVCKILGVQEVVDQWGDGIESSPKRINSHAKPESLFRSNLRFSATHVKTVQEKPTQLIQLLAHDPRFSTGPVIVYCWKRRTVDDIAKLLGGRALSCKGYHSSLAAEARSLLEKDFMENRVRILVATVAFGVGIDKPDVVGVVHYDLPKSIENFVQESGRAARGTGPGGGKNLIGHCHVLLDDETYREQRKFCFGSVGAYGVAVERIMDTFFPPTALGEEEKHTLPSSSSSSSEMIAPLGPPPNPVDSPARFLSFAASKNVEKSVLVSEDELHSLLAVLERVASPHITLYALFPGRIKLRFFGDGLDALVEKDPFLKALAPVLKENSGVHTFDTLAAMEAVTENALFAAHPGEFLSNLHTCSSLHRFSVMRDKVGFLLDMAHPPCESRVAIWADKVRRHLRLAERASAGQLDATFVVAARVARECKKETDEIFDVFGAPKQDPDSSNSSTLVRTLIDAYFDAGEDSDPIAAVAGGEEEKFASLSKALATDEAVLRRVEAGFCDPTSREAIASLERAAWASDSRYPTVRDQVRTFCASASFWEAMKGSREPSLFASTVLLGKFSMGLLGPDRGARTLWMKHPAYGALKETGFGLVHSAIEDVREELMGVEIKRKMNF